MTMTGITGKPLRINSCGECRLCCKLIGVPSLDKPAGRWCGHCGLSNEPGCKIYGSRALIAPECVEFECGWLASDSPAEFRPDRINMIVTGESDQLDAFIIHVDPAHPNAYTTPYGQAVIMTLLDSGKHKNIVLVIGDKRRYIGDPNGALRIEAAQRRMESQR